MTRSRIGRWLVWLFGGARPAVRLDELRRAERVNRAVTEADRVVEESRRERRVILEMLLTEDQRMGGDAR